MKAIARFAVNNPVTVLMFVLAIILLGFISFGKLGTDLFPDLMAAALQKQDLSAWVTFRIEPDLNLSDDTVAAIRSSGLLGDKFISLKPGASGVPLKPAATIVDTESTVDLEDLISRFAFGSVDKK